jgi:hypothetical protein
VTDPDLSNSVWAASIAVVQERCGFLDFFPLLRAVLVFFKVDLFRLVAIYIYYIY